MLSNKPLDPTIEKILLEIQAEILAEFGVEFSIADIHLLLKEQSRYVVNELKSKSTVHITGLGKFKHNIKKERLLKKRTSLKKQGLSKEQIDKQMYETACRMSRKPIRIVNLQVNKL